MYHLPEPSGTLAWAGPVTPQLSSRRFPWGLAIRGLALTLGSVAPFEWGWGEVVLPYYRQARPAPPGPRAVAIQGWTQRVLGLASAQGG